MTLAQTAPRSCELWIRVSPLDLFPTSMSQNSSSLSYGQRVAVKRAQRDAPAQRTASEIAIAGVSQVVHRRCHRGCRRRATAPARARRAQTRLEPPPAAQRHCPAAEAGSVARHRRTGTAPPWPGPRPIGSRALGPSRPAILRDRRRSRSAAQIFIPRSRILLDRAVSDQLHTAGCASTARAARPPRAPLPPTRYTAAVASARQLSSSISRRAHRVPPAQSESILHCHCKVPVWVNAG